MRNKMDEMDRQIQLLSEERGYRVIVLALALWVLYNCWQAFFRGEAYVRTICSPRGRQNARRDAANHALDLILRAVRRDADKTAP